MTEGIQEARVAAQSEQEVAGCGEKGERGVTTRDSQDFRLTLFSSDTRGNDMGRRNKVGLCLPT